MTDDLPTPEECFANAARLLRNAELVSDRELMHRYESLADSWVVLGTAVESEVRG